MEHVVEECLSPALLVGGQELHERQPQLEPFSAGPELLSPQRQSQWLWVFLAVGLAARLVRYLLRFPLWEDEAMLSANLPRPRIPRPAASR